MRFLGATTTACNSDVKIYVTKDFKVFLCNTSDNDLRMPPGELFGFGLGSFAEKLAGPNYSADVDMQQFIHVMLCPHVAILYDVNQCDRSC